MSNKNMKLSGMYPEFETIPRYFDKKGNPIDLHEWGSLRDDKNYRIVSQDIVGEYFVSTVWVGLNMSYWKSLPIKIFETMIFQKNKDWNAENKDPILSFQQRYSTEEEAIVGHEYAIMVAKGEISIIEEQ